MLVSHPTLRDEDLSLHVFGLIPHQRAILRASLYDDCGVCWSSWGEFEATAQGTISLQTQASLNGTYQGIDPNGLLWSMLPNQHDAPLFRLERGVISCLIDLECEGKIVESVEALRLGRSPEVHRVELRTQGLLGTFFFPPAASCPSPLVIVLGGSGGGLKECRAQLLASRGIAALALAYFGEAELPKRLERIPLEYFEKALDAAAMLREIDPMRIGLWGISRGAELALLLGAKFSHRIKALCAYVPSSISWGSFPSNAPCWTWGNAELLPPASLPSIKLSPQEGMSVEHPLQATKYFQEALLYPEQFEPSFLPVEEISCPLLLVSGEDDQMWPSTTFCCQIEELLRSKQSRIPVRHLAYPGAGHHFVLPHTPTTRTSEKHPKEQIWFAFGGTPQADAFARKDAWEQTLSFFRRSFV